MKCYALTDVGRERSNNQDSFAYKTVGDSLVCVVCDGMGGAAGGGIASTIAKDIYMSELQKKLREYSEHEDTEGAPETIVPRLMREAVTASNSFTYTLSVGDPSLKGMGTTLVSVVLYKDKLYFCNVGDSRAYGFFDGTPVQITKDHSYVQELIDRGRISEIDAASDPQRNIITRAIGVEDTVRADTFVMSMRSAEYVLLCTDGLSNYLSGEDMKKIIYQPSELLSFERKVQCLVDLANSRGGADNITALLIGLRVS